MKDETDESIDITSATCPMTFVLVKLKLETMTPGQRLRVRLNGGEPLDNLPRTLADEGCLVSPPWRDGNAFGMLVTKP
ncbi:MAG: sulfurtransferase TusA family protein [Magnetococcales bacterium]|nr:sulfurtransferase TusA family protein [Magnetococcales bacterium]